MKGVNSCLLAADWILFDLTKLKFKEKRALWFGRSNLEPVARSCFKSHLKSQPNPRARTQFQLKSILIFNTSLNYYEILVRK